MLAHSDEIDKLAEALAKAQGTIEIMDLNRVNRHFNSKYADISETRRVTREPLSQNGLAVMQFPSTEGGRFSLVTMLTHSSGQWVKNILHMPLEKNTAQGVASTNTYARRIGIQSVLGLVGDEDDDGEATAGRQNSTGDNKKQEEAQPVVFDENNMEHINFITSSLKYPVERLERICHILHGKTFNKSEVQKAIKESEQQ